MSFSRRIRKIFWSILAPHWATLRDLLLRLGIIWHEPGRQRFHLGWLREDKTPDEFMHHLQDIGFGNHTLAWVDDEEYFGLRRDSDENEDFQYHVRLFDDREIRGHYEYKTEASWYKHFWEVGMESRKDDFIKFLGDWVVLEKPASSLPKKQIKSHVSSRGD